LPALVFTEKDDLTPSSTRFDIVKALLSRLNANAVLSTMASLLTATEAQPAKNAVSKTTDTNTEARLEIFDM
jgi:hypothetical protein